MNSDKVNATVEAVIKLEELRLIIDEMGLFELIDAIPQLLKKREGISINDGLKIVAGIK